MEDSEQLFSKSAAFADVQPIPQNDGPDPPTTGAGAHCLVTDAMNYFRAMLQKNEMSERALLVTTRVIQCNAACYTAWYFRRLILVALKSDLTAELALTSQMSKSHPKNYQVWYHRRWLVEQLNDPSQELGFTAQILEIDSKNYHSWTHRQWAIKTFNLWEKEIEYTEKLLTDDVRNNSAWNQRYFVIANTTEGGLPVGPSPAKEAEIEFAQKKIRLSPNNESPWNYMLGMAKGSKLTEFPSIVSFCKEHEDKWTFCANLLSVLSDIAVEEGDIEKAKRLCETLSNSVDNIHQKYWVYRKSLLK